MTQTVAYSETARCFSKPGYRALISSFIDFGYETVTFDSPDLSPQLPQLIVRHDVDMSLELAREIAEIEKDLGIKSTYFVMLTSPLYNPHTRNNCEHLAALVDLGREIGLHFDLTVYQDDASSLGSEELERWVQSEARVLERLAGAEVRTMSFHRPAKELQGYPHQIGGLIHSYEPRFFNDIAYISDSEGRWRFGHPLDHEAVKQRQAVQLLTHPIWWALGQPDSNVASVLDRFVDRENSEYRASLAANCRSYRPQTSTQRQA